MRLGLAFFLAVIFPLLDVWATRRLKRSSDPNKKVKSYLNTVALLWVAAGAAWALDHAGLFYRLQPAEQGGWDVGPLVPWTVAAGVLGAWLLQVLLVRRSEQRASQLQKSFAKLAFFLPSTRPERRLFVLVAMTAGICEEVLYRGFLFHFLRNHLGLAALSALLLQAAAFGIAHVYQGWKGVMATAFLGAYFCVLYLGTGSLLLPIVLHVALDLRLLLFPAAILSGQKPQSQGSELSSS